MKALLRTLLGHDGLPRVHRKERDCPATMDAMFRQLRRHCRSSDSLSNGLQLLPSSPKTRRVVATVVDGAASNEITAKLPHLP